MFKLEPNPTFASTVPISTPDGDSVPLRVVFKHKKRSELNAFLEASGRNEDQMLKEMIASSPDLPEGMELYEFLAQVIENYPAAPSDFIRHYVKELAGSRIKN